MKHGPDTKVYFFFNCKEIKLNGNTMHICFIQSKCLCSSLDPFGPAGTDPAVIFISAVTYNFLDLAHNIANIII